MFNPKFANNLPLPLMISRDCSEQYLNEILRLRKECIISSYLVMLRNMIITEVILVCKDDKITEANEEWQRITDEIESSTGVLDFDVKIVSESDISYTDIAQIN